MASGQEPAAAVAASAGLNPLLPVLADQKLGEPLGEGQLSHARNPVQQESMRKALDQPGQAIQWS